MGLLATSVTVKLQQRWCKYSNVWYFSVLINSLQTWCSRQTWGIQSCLRYRFLHWPFRSIQISKSCSGILSWRLNVCTFFDLALFRFQYYSSLLYSTVFHELDLGQVHVRTAIRERTNANFRNYSCSYRRVLRQHLLQLQTRAFFRPD